MFTGLDDNETCGCGEFLAMGLVGVAKDTGSIGVAELVVMLLLAIGSVVVGGGLG